MLSVIICTYNREKFLHGALNSLKNQTLDKKKYEIIVVNNNSTDNTENVCVKFKKENPQLNYKYVTETQQGLSSARNKGIKISEGEIITFIDDDAEANVNFCANIIKYFNLKPNVSAIGGKVIPIYPNNKEPEWMSKYLWGLVAKVDNGEVSGKFRKKYPVGCNMSFRKNLFKKYGVFNEDLTFRGDEKFFFYKLKNGNENIHYIADAIVYHNIESKRITKEGVKRIAVFVGEAERIRLQSKGFLIKTAKFLEYVLKIIISILIGIKFVFSNKPAKAKYLIRTMIYTLRGYLIK